MQVLHKIFLAAALGLVVGRAFGTAPVVQPPAWPDTFMSRVEALALLQTLNGELLSHDSATATLERWCAVHRLASPAHVTAVRDARTDKPATAALRMELGVDEHEPVRYRHVRLQCGAVVLSEADNWYVPGRLTREMDQLLDTTDTPFGKAVLALHFQRRTVAVTFLWLALPSGWEMSGATPAAEEPGALAIPPQLLQHHALLMTPDGVPFSEVVETYTRGVLAFPSPAL